MRLALVLPFVFVHSLSAQDQQISQMVHTAWTGRDGAPQSINALAQTPDGVLWIGTNSGLFSFDGLTFTTFQPRAGDPALPSYAIASLFVSRSGELWVECFRAGIARIFNGHLNRSTV